MRVLQVVTLVSPDGAYGGPVRVAVNQCVALQELGHSVVLAAGVQGFEISPNEIESVPAHLFPVRHAIPRTGFAGLISPGLHRWFVKHKEEFDVIHVHMARDLVTLPLAAAALRAGLPVVLQTHGMIDRSTNPLSIPLDALLTRRVLRRASATLFLTDKERHDVAQVAGPLQNQRWLGNGVPNSHHADEPKSGVLFLARLHKRKRPADFVRAAAALHDKYPDVTWTLIGPDEGEGSALTDLLAENGSINFRRENAIPPEHTIHRMAKAAIYCLPSVNEPYPMSVLEAMSVGTPVVVTDTCGLADVVQSSGSGLVTDGTVPSLVDALDTLLKDPNGTKLMGQRAATVARSHFGMKAIGTRLASLYTEAVKES